MKREEGGGRTETSRISEAGGFAPVEVGGVAVGRVDMREDQTVVVGRRRSMLSEVSKFFLLILFWLTSSSATSSR